MTPITTVTGYVVSFKHAKSQLRFEKAYSIAGEAAKTRRPASALFYCIPIGIAIRFGLYWYPIGDPPMGQDKPDVWQGTLALMILKTLESMGPLHGYGIARRIDQTSGD